RFSLRTNVDIKPTDWLSAGTSIFYTHKNLDGGRMNLLMATAMSPYSKPYKDDGNIEIFPMYPELVFVNPVIELAVERLVRGNNLQGGGYLEFAAKIVEGLMYRLKGSYDMQFARYADYTGRQSNNNSGTAVISGNQT